MVVKVVEGGEKARKKCETKKRPEAHGSAFFLLFLLFLFIIV
jgi:hypothetical protein